MVNKDNFRNIDPYVPGDQPDFADMVKLNTNENPYPPAPAVLKAAEEFSAGRLKLYPPTDGGALRRELAAYHGISPENVFVGVGSDDVLAVIFQTCFNSGRKLFFPEISYSFYEVWAELYRVPYCKIPLKAGFTIDPDDYIKVVNGMRSTTINPHIFKDPSTKNNEDIVAWAWEAYRDGWGYVWGSPGGRWCSAAAWTG